eukprot:XP_019928638.1 PREDICTED: uncharacterized protein LOC105342629 isoform X2 [Crassostrea gigas]
MGVAALAHVVLLVLGCALRALLKHFHVQCRTPMRRRPRTKQEMCVLEEGSLIFQKPTSGGGGLKIEEVEMSETRAPEEKDDSPLAQTCAPRRRTITRDM